MPHLLFAAVALLQLQTAQTPDRIEFVRKIDKLMVGQQVQLVARVFAKDTVIRGAWIAWRASSSSYTSLAADGRITGVKPGRLTIMAAVGNVVASFPLEVVPNTIASLTISPAHQPARVGDVVRLQLDTRDAAGARIAGITPTWTVTPEADGYIDDGGAFSARQPGLFTIMATIGDWKTVATVRVAPRSDRPAANSFRDKRPF